MSVDRLQFTGRYIDGEPELVEPADLSVGTKDDTPPEHGAQINPHGGSLTADDLGEVQRIQVGSEAKAASDLEAAQVRVENFMNELNRLRSVNSAGIPIDSTKITNLQHELNDTLIAYVGSGGSEHDPEMAALRDLVDEISRDARQNKR